MVVSAQDLNDNVSRDSSFRVLRHQDDSTALMRAARAGYAEVVDTLILHGADVNAKDWVCVFDEMSF